MIHNLRMKTIIKTYDAMGNLKMSRTLDGKKITENTFDIVIEDKKGNLIKEIKDIPVKSYVNNFLCYLYNFLAGGFAPSSPVDLRIRNNNNGIGSSNIGQMIASATQQGGLRVGGGDTAVTIADYTLPSFITIGTGSGQLTHSSHTNVVPQKVGTETYKISHYRSFTNNSGAPIDIKSCGLYLGFPTNTVNDITLQISDRFDLNGNPINITLNDGQAMTVTYNQYFDLSEGFVFGLPAQMYNGYAGNITSGLNAIEWGGTSIFAGAFDNNTTNVPKIICGVGVNYGIRVGEGQTAITIDDYNLDTMIDIGTGAGQLTHGACEIGIPIERIGSSERFSVTRSLLNQSGSTIIYRSMGIFARRYHAVYVPDDTKRMLLIKKLTGNVIIPDAGSSVLEQIFEIVV